MKASKKEKGKGKKKAIKIERRLNCEEGERWMWLRGRGLMVVGEVIKEKRDEGGGKRKRRKD